VGSGTVTSVGGTGTVAGLTLTGTVTSSGNLTLGGNLTIAADMIYDNFTATASQTAFTPSATYTSGKIEVFCNGVKMVNGSDVTVTSGTSVVFATGLTAGDLVNLVYPI
jgi:lipid-binding SYLF domain-containing protein